ncbi:MAG: endo-1,4-beta-xylanase [Bacteroidetes bacterium]|nr:endo-1,4-beta-xylanase [Bacteroidota bacterium]
MKKGAKFLFRPAAVGIMILLVIAGLQAQLVTNGSFEECSVGPVSGTDVNGWVIEVDGSISPAPTIEIISDTVQSGSRAIKVGINAIGPDAWSIQLIGDSIPVIPGETYLATIWAKAQNASGQAVFSVGNYAYSEYGQIRPSSPNITTSWQQFSFSFTINDQQTYARAPIHFNFATNVGNIIYIDNLKIVNVNDSKKPVIVEAESGTGGSHYAVMQSGDVTYISPTTNNANLTYPGDSSRIKTYQVTFADSGSYNLFARVRVGASTFNDDSFFYGHGFGIKDTASADDWYMVNGLANAGFSNAGDFVDGPGSIGSGVWKWINITKNVYNSKGDSFYVSMDSLTRVFQIASREDGLDIDKLAFGKSYLYYTVNNLDSIQAGSSTGKAVDTSLIYKGPALAAGQDKFLGNVGDPPESIFLNYWNQLTPENAGKFVSVAGSSIDTTAWNWSPLTAAYNFAVNNNLIFKDHCLIWGQQQPTWISSLDSAQKVFYLETWIRMVGEKFPDMDLIDVVNEPLPNHNPPDGLGGRANYKDAIGGNGTTGWDWVVWAFTKARQYMPNTKLILNDYGIINDNNATTNYLQIINILNDRGLIDGIGVQGHRFELESGDTGTFRYNLSRLAATGLPIYISEFDLGNASDAGTADDNQQLQFYQRIFPTLWNHPGVKGITLWGYIEGRMWQNTCYLVHADFTSRPAMSWLIQYVKDHPAGVEETASTMPLRYRLEQNYPNPFNPSTQIQYSIPQNGRVLLKIYNLLGQEVATLFEGNQNTGTYTATFDGSRLSSGVYFYRLQVHQTNGRNSYSETKKLMLLK